MSPRDRYWVVFAQQRGMSVAEAKLKTPRTMFEEQFQNFLEVGFESWVPMAVQLSWNWPSSKNRPRPQDILKTLIATWLYPDAESEGSDMKMRADVASASATRNKVSIHDSFWDENPYFKANPEELKRLREAERAKK